MRKLRKVRQKRLSDGFTAFSLALFAALAIYELTLVQEYEELVDMQNATIDKLMLVNGLKIEQVNK